VDLTNPLVLGLPRGGVPVAKEVADVLDAELDVMIVRKIGAPGQPEFAIGAIASGGVRILDERTLAMLGIDNEVLDGIIDRESTELARREAAYRAGREPPELKARSVLLIDDGIATGSTMRAAIRAARQKDAAEVIVAVPTAAPGSARELEREADQFICIDTPDPYIAVGQWYADFRQTTDAEVLDLLTGTPRR